MASPVLSSFIPGGSPALTTFKFHLQRPSLVDEVRQAMRRFDLDQGPPGNRSALDLLNEAVATHARPPSATPSPAGVLLPARESLNVALAELLRRRPQQKRAASPESKVASIGAQCGLDRLPLDHFELLGRELRTLLDKLSGGKQDSVPVPEIARLLDEVLHFHKAFLSSLNRAKLRR
jgi:hypothetical protein